LKIQETKTGSIPAIRFYLKRYLFSENKGLYLLSYDIATLLYCDGEEICLDGYQKAIDIFNRRKQ